MTIRHVLGLEPNLQVRDLLISQYEERRGIDAELGISGSVRFFISTIAGEQTQRPTIQYEYESLSALAEAQEKRNGNARWNELNQVLTEAGMQIRFNAITNEWTPGS
jgi:hypothetical protein